MDFVLASNIKHGNAVVSVQSAACWDEYNIASGGSRIREAVGAKYF